MGQEKNRPYEMIKELASDRTIPNQYSNDDLLSD